MVIYISVYNNELVIFPLVLENVEILYFEKKFIELKGFYKLKII